MSKKHPSRVFGHIPGYESGHHFENRRELHNSGVHVQARSGIHGDSSPGGGAFSVYLARNKYEDNVDYGNKIIYVGSGGQDKQTKEQIADQSFDDHPNRALYISYVTKKPVRVIRGPDRSNQWAPSFGYDYDGLYVVHSATMKRGKAGFNMCFVELRRIENDDAQVASSPQEN
ncbi:E3 ubiquitin-protein ligase UHRF1 [Boletus reticuloceps]|uniref:E3 ubiquitin-protein ligase UHRF1 n=1 Tax=Boletus reticuloceps TaxID=495285 RepID=A0A8I2YPX2_9AGAM|nr:E3 ubiquitin-protein ligase UHRF1 [Boletus reticuloceps]